MAAVSASGAAALLLWALGGKDSLRLGVPKLTWEWDDPSAAPLERTKAGLANSLFPHRQCYELPSVRTVPFIGVLVMAAAIVSIKYAGAAHAIRCVEALPSCSGSAVACNHGGSRGGASRK